MSSTERDTMRALLKSFGIQADEAVIVYLTRNPEIKSLQIRLMLEDLTDYGNTAPEGSLTLALEGTVDRQA